MEGDANAEAAAEALREELDRIDRDQAFTEAFLTRYGDPGAELLTTAFDNGWRLVADEDRSDRDGLGAASGWEIDLGNRTIWVDAEDTGWFYNEDLDPAAMADALWAALNAKDAEGNPVAGAPMLRADTLQAGDYPTISGTNGITAFSTSMGMTRDLYWHVSDEVTLSVVLCATGVGMARAAGGADDLIDSAQAAAAGKRAAATADAAAIRARRAAYEAPSLNMDKQGKHIPGHNNYLDHQNRSLLTADPERLLRENWGTGRQVGDVPFGTAGHKEMIDFGETIGYHIHPKTLEATQTRWGWISYDSQGTAHIVPVNPSSQY